MRRYGWHTAFGLVLALAAYGVSFSLFAWMTPVIVGLMLAIPLAQWTASPAAGRCLRRMKLLLVPEESRAAGYPAARQRTRRGIRARGSAECAPAPAVRRSRAARRASRPAARRAGAQARRGRRRAGDRTCQARRLRDASTEADAMLTRQEKMALLSDARGVERLAALAAQ